MIGTTFFHQREDTTAVKLALLPPAYHTTPPQAHHYYLACVTLPVDVSYFGFYINLFFIKNWNSSVAYKVLGYLGLFFFHGYSREFVCDEMLGKSENSNARTGLKFNTRPIVRDE